MGLLGPNGAGKTTLVETIEGYHAPVEGQVRVFGVDPRINRQALTPRWGVMPQAGGFIMGQTVAETIELFLHLHSSDQNLSQILAATGLRDLAKRRWRRLSGGQQQRLSLALALCGGRDLLILDEATAALDSEGRSLVIDLITQRAHDGAAVLLTTHQFSDIERSTDRIVVLDQGQAIASGSLAELTTGQAHIRFVTAPNLNTANLAALLNAPVAETDPGSYQASLVPSPTAMSAITAWLTEQNLVAESMAAGTRTLEEMLTSLTGSESNHKDPKP